jgi:hypothetical protein
MFVASEAEATAIRAAYEQEGELSATIELRRLFPGITDNENARRCVRSIASWSPVPVPIPKAPRRPRKGRTAPDGPAKAQAAAGGSPTSA